MPLPSFKKNFKMQKANIAAGLANRLACGFTLEHDNVTTALTLRSNPSRSFDVTPCRSSSGCLYFLQPFTRLCFPDMHHVESGVAKPFVCLKVLSISTVKVKVLSASIVPSVMIGSWSREY